MSSIFASKLYKTSKRQASIKCALSDLVNLELVQQLHEYLGDDYQDEPSTAPEKDAKVIKRKNKQSNEDSADTAAHKVPKPIAPVGGPHPSLSEKYGDALDADGNAAFDATNVDTSDTSSEESTESTTGEGTVAESTRITASDCTIPLTENKTPIAGLAGVLSGTLNLHTDTCGVSRVGVKGDEIWIYYNDDINLNNRMGPVIELLNASSYSYLTFNRLARTDNAIVFTISSNDTLTSTEAAVYE